MLRKIVAVALAVSFIAMATSGVMMFVVEQPSFTIQMHPVHKLFGLVMILAVIGHISLNYRALSNHLKTRAVSIIGGVLVAVMVVLYGVAMTNGLPEHIAVPMDELAAQAELNR